MREVIKFNFQLSEHCRCSPKEWEERLAKNGAENKENKANGHNVHNEADEESD